jgi:hypothetical protein
VHVNRTPARAGLLIAILAVAIMALGLDAAASYTWSSVARPHSRDARSAKPSRAPRSRTATGKRASRKSKCVTTAVRRGHGAKRGAVAVRCAKKPAKRKRGASGAKRGSSQSAPTLNSSAGLAPATRQTQTPTTGASPPSASGGEPGSSQEPTSPGAPATPFPFFSPTSFWNQPVPAGAPLDPSSAAVVGAFDALIAAEEQAKNGPWINTASYSIPVYTVSANQPTVTVQLENHAPSVALSSAWSAVPLPADAQPAAGTDGVLVVWQPSTDRLWEFWRLVHQAGSWYASWGGAMQNVSSSSGVYGPEAWPGAKPWWGSSASSLSLVGGLISLEDLNRGEINHALSMAIPNVRAGVYASPAQRDDGKSIDLLSLPEGAHLRLNPNLNLAALHLPRLTLMIAEAAQRYGIFVRDWAPNVAFYAQDPIPTGTSPYAGPHGYFEGKNPRELLSSFPWSQLELLNMELHNGT